MIQRIQTLYLLLVILLTGLGLWLPLATFTIAPDAASPETYTLTAFGLRDATGALVQSTVYLAILQIACCALPLVTIFLFKRRLLQVRLCASELVLLLGAAGMTAIYFYLSHRFFSSYELFSQQLRLTLLFPVAALVFDYLAMRAIFRDEKLVRSLDRIR